LILNLACANFKWILIKNFMGKKTSWNHIIKSLTTAGILVVFLFLLPLVFGENISKKQKSSNISSLPENTQIATKEEERSEPSSFESKNLGKKYKVLNVVDGDTIAVEIDGKKEVLRLIGMNTPETVDPRKPVECFGIEASKKAKEILSGKMVMLEKDETQGELDKYNRLLRYVYLEDGTSFNKLMIKEGYAYEYTYNTPYRYQAEFKAAQQKAEKEKRGLWANDACNGELNRKTEPQSPINSKDNDPTAVAPTGEFICNCTKTCSQMSSCAEAQFQLDTCGCSNRDVDQDGIACESNCQ
jgi:micrococcal nuclease